METILIVEDDRMLNNGVSFALQKEGYEVLSAYTWSEGMQRILQEKIDLLLLDINLPDGNGLELVDDIRGKTRFPIVLFTANDTEEDMVKGYETGCDDYIAKPFSVELLRHKIHAILKRSSGTNKNVLEYRTLKIDFDRRLVTVEQKAIDLTVTEYKLLELLAKNMGSVITKEILLEKLWDNWGNFVDENTLSVNVRRLRKKIEKEPKNPQFILTVFGIGYVFGG